jgi:hypothetical protein
LSSDGDYRTYLRNAKREGIAKYFSKDQLFYQEVCTYLNTYAKGQEKGSILEVISSIDNPDADILNILIGATLDACGYKDTGNELIGLAITGLIVVGLTALLASVLSKK